MSNKYRIATMADFLALTPDQRARCAVDMVAWAKFTDAVLPSGLLESPDKMIWVDDCRTGEVSGVVLTDGDGRDLFRVDIPRSRK
jgi:hypothetical protein